MINIKKFCKTTFFIYKTKLQLLFQIENIQHDPPTDVNLGARKVRHANSESENNIFSSYLPASVHDIGTYFNA